VPCTVLDPFLGSGTTGLVAARLGRDSKGIELSPGYVDMDCRRLKEELGMLVEIEVHKIF
jgi:DNA modification methylase